MESPVIKLTKQKFLFLKPILIKLFKKWLEVSRRKPPKIKGDIFFCANHFHETDIIKFSTNKCIKPNQAVPLKMWRLKSGALPKTPKSDKN